ncbi:hypothetical protein JOF48_003166 [Arthrobacter stackebrandtii]|uniref:DUF1269 domain-containing protein n=1 Tax=Arthrobacter stackebrandtii TaxID=272161 RepID=A0ABS4YZY5_9MICC|nr:DUF6325 family protein [Arthrobacter stackebrandtii]MBP2414367.1 hypothetical protein [Arthrobacter stackebrandtii]PYH01507.1 hypothetical protein CVV67_03230 [Arthrobacter stackebrandtii]
MAEQENFDYGPVEIFTVEFPGEAPSPGVLESLARLESTGTVRLLDMVLAGRAADGSLRISELTKDDAAAAGLAPALPGLIGEEDATEAAQGMPEGTGVALVALELSWATELAGNVAAANGTVTDSIRIPAPIVNGFINEFGQADA